MKIDLPLLERLARRLAERLQSSIPRGVGFTLLVFDAPSVEGWITYISNADRADMLKTMKELMGRWQRQELEGFTAADIDAVAHAMNKAAGIDLPRDVMRKLAAAAVALGASPGLARCDLEGR